MSGETLMFIAIIALIALAVPAWPYSRSWGYAPSGFLAVLLVVMFIWAANNGHMPGQSSSDRLSADMKRAGEDLKDAGRDTSDSLRRTLQ
jgi:hypothetical protein